MERNGGIRWFNERGRYGFGDEFGEDISSISDQGKVMEEIVKRIWLNRKYLNVNLCDYIGGHLKKKKKKKRKATIEENGSSETLHGTRRASFRILL